MLVRLIFITLFTLIASGLYAQLDSNKIVELSKGKWRLPIDSPKYEIRLNRDKDVLTACDLHFGLGFRSTYLSDIYSVRDGTVVSIFCVEDMTGVIRKYGDYYFTYAVFFDCYLRSIRNLVLKLSQIDFISNAAASFW